MNKYTKPKIDETKLTRNPLVASDFTIFINKIKDKSAFIKDEDGIWLPKEVDVEKENITKLYTKAENRLLIAHLTPKARSLYIWLAYEIECGKDYLWLNQKRYMEEFKESLNTFKAAREELCEFLVIYPTLEKEYYWINPRLFFCGSRIAKYSKDVVEYEPVKSKHDKE